MLIGAVHRLLLVNKQGRREVNMRYLFFILMVFIVSACSSSYLKSTTCSRYKYSEEQQSWLDYSGRSVACTIADGVRIFDWIPPKGCQHWVDVFAIDKSAKVSEIAIQYGNTSRKYCVLQRYIHLGNSGQVLVLDGAYCLQKSDQGQNTYSMMSSCEGVSTSPAPSTQNTPSGN